MLDPSKTTYQKSPRFDSKLALFRINVTRDFGAVRWLELGIRAALPLNTPPFVPARGL